MANTTNSLPFPLGPLQSPGAAIDSQPTSAVTRTLLPGPAGSTNNGRQPGDSGNIHEQPISDPIEAARPIRTWPTPLRRIGGWTVLTIVLVVTARTLLAGSDIEHASRRPARRSSTTIDAALRKTEPKQPTRLREGTTLSNTRGTFKPAGDRIAFYAQDGPRAFRLLENLALERVWCMLDETRGRQWNVSGTITEYRGANYLMITRAVLTAK